MKPIVRQGKRRDLTDSERVALRNIDEGTPVDQAVCNSLKRQGLVELKENAWITTQQGHFELMFQKAR